MRKIIAITALSILSFSQVAQADYTISQYKKIKDDERFNLYLTGYVNGLEWANVNMISNGLPPLFCTPVYLALTADNAIQLFDDYLARHKSEGGDFMELHMVAALQKAFPCK